MDPATSLLLLRPNNPPFSEPLRAPSPSISLSLSVSPLCVEVGVQKQAQKQL